VSLIQRTCERSQRKGRSTRPHPIAIDGIIRLNLAFTTIAASVSWRRMSYKNTCGDIKLISCQTDIRTLSLDIGVAYVQSDGYSIIAVRSTDLRKRSDAICMSNLKSIFVSTFGSIYSRRSELSPTSVPFVDFSHLTIDRDIIFTSFGSIGGCRYSPQGRPIK
jgi:tRNA(His) 5'-end guanylyltransferase